MVMFNMRFQVIRDEGLATLRNKLIRSSFYLRSLQSGPFPYPGENQHYEDRLHTSVPQGMTL